MLSSRTSRVDTAVMRTPRLPGRGVAQRLWLECDGIRAVAGDFAAEPVQHADVDGDLLAGSTTQRQGADDGGSAAQSGGAAVGHPDTGLAGVGPFPDCAVHDLAQVDLVGALYRAGRADGGDVGADAGQPERAGGVAVTVVADQVPTAPVGDDAPGLDGAGGVGVAAG